jgi:hypothetical protein
MPGGMDGPRLPERISLGPSGGIPGLQGLTGQDMNSTMHWMGGMVHFQTSIIFATRKNYRTLLKNG